MSRLAGAVAMVFGLAVGSAVVKAGEPIIVFTDHSRVLSVSRPPATVIVGNPSIADVTVQGNNVLLHARSYGDTNVIILDDEGNQLADYEVTVQHGGRNNVAIFKAGYRYSYVCAPLCEATLNVGDEKDYLLKWIGPQQQFKNKVSLGQKQGENTDAGDQASSDSQ